MRREWRRRGVAVGVVLLAALSACTESGEGGQGARPEDAEAGAAAGLLATTTSVAPTTTAPPTGPDGPYNVGSHTETFVDASRPTEANNSAPALPTRTLPTLILYPAVGVPAASGEVAEAEPLVDEGPFPLVIYNHGVTATGPVYAARMREWAEAGYVVAAPTFPLSRGGAPGGPSIQAYRNQPEDVRFVLDELLRLDGAQGTILSDLVDGERIAVGGHSLGAITTLGFGFNTCCGDERVDAFLPMAGVQLPFTDGEFRFDDSVPLLLVHGDADGTVPFGGSEAVYAAASGPKHLLRLLGAPHTPFFGGPWPEVVDAGVIGFLDAYLKDRPDGLDRLRAAGSRPGVSSLQSEAEPES
ncbi:hypothetical protein BH18ACT1_BH18ACT1_01480 [soil metagenome]